MYNRMYSATNNSTIWIQNSSVAVFVANKSDRSSWDTNLSIYKKNQKMPHQPSKIHTVGTYIDIPNHPYPRAQTQARVRDL